jgi:hypothetical protein
MTAQLSDTDVSATVAGPLDRSRTVGAFVPHGSGCPEPLTEHVAHIVAGIPLIGVARNALQHEGWSATITGNRIAVDDDVVVQYIPCSEGRYGKAHARWVVYSMARSAPVWIVTAESDSQ